MDTAVLQTVPVVFLLPDNVAMRSLNLAKNVNISSAVQESALFLHQDVQRQERSAILIRAVVSLLLQGIVVMEPFNSIMKNVTLILQSRMEDVLLDLHVITSVCVQMIRWRSAVMDK